ncbi:hypothetical protein CEK71_21110 [Methylovulum psychrotolerans]|uniref:Uncharacterized protein n=2 Tax=Methylovulum psychrotolerans TaxID=1704499 RepID=A0A1Z4C4B5_9GAMM|nr:hypothetical protein CEK71_21110 [Methylovulum psychrotolerans]
MLSVYRGQADKGLGSGPGMPVLSGEQFLMGTDLELYKEDKLLSTIQPWVTLDSSPEDHRQENLEVWSCFCAGQEGKERIFVTRMVLAGYHDRRVAYFSHARSWPVGMVSENSDPGAILGYSEMFDPPGLEQRGESTPQLEHISNLAKDYWLPHLQAETETAIQFLGYLLQVMQLKTESSYPLVIGVPLHDFKQGSPLFPLVAFARAALPAALKPHCSIRMHTRQPENFAARLNARLLVVPENMVRDVLRVKPEAIFLNRQGECKIGCALEEKYHRYAKGVLDLVFWKPDGLLPFSAFLGEAKVALLEKFGWDNSLIGQAYSLATAINNEKLLESVFRQVMRKESSPTFPWDELLEDKDWERFPELLLNEFALEPLANPGELKLQTAVTHALGHLDRTLDACFIAQRELAAPDEKIAWRQLQRLLELLRHPKPLFSDEVMRQEVLPLLNNYLLPYPDSEEKKSFQTEVMTAIKVTGLTQYITISGLQDIDAVNNLRDRKQLVHIFTLWGKGLIHDFAIKTNLAAVLCHVVLAPTDKFTENDRNLQTEAEEALEHLELTLDDALQGWLQSLNTQDRPAKIKRLLHLLGKVSLFSDRLHLIWVTQSIKLNDWIGINEPLSKLLKLESETPSKDDNYYQLEKRGPEQLALIAKAGREDDCYILIEATIASHLSTKWANTFIDSADIDNDRQVLQALLNALLNAMWGRMSGDEDWHYKLAIKIIDFGRKN